MDSAVDLLDDIVWFDDDAGGQNETELDILECKGITRRL